MTTTTISRRGLIATAAMTAAAGAISPASAQKIGDLDLADPKTRAMVRAKVQGSIAEETVYSFYRLHLYGYVNEGNLVPLTTMNNLNITKWKPLPGGNYAGTVFESGSYCKFDTDEPIEVWENPFTGEKRDVWPFIGGPLKVELGPDGGVTDETATVKPKAQRIDIIGDTIFVVSQSAFSFPNPLKPEEWPKESAGPTYFWDSHFVHAAKVADVVNPKLTRAGAFSQFQNLVSWHPWFGMGGKPGRTYGKAYGTKLKSLDELPKAARATLEKQTPEIFDVDNWTKPRLDFPEYMAWRKAKKS
ncbi:MAG: DUF1838 family protein [Rhodospirillaceae bacterium]|nr:DUF1838 family protein [Rhodospirillaceae bacterium]